MNARLYLATAYAQQYIPGVDAEDNNRLGQQAIDQYKAVLERDPKSMNSVKGIAYIYLQMKKFEDAKAVLSQGHSNSIPNDPEAVLLGGRHRLDTDLSAAHGRARQARA